MTATRLKMPTPSTALVTLVLLALANCLSFVHRVLPGAVAPLLKAEFSLTDAEVGLVTGFAFSLFYAFAGLPLAQVADKGPRRVLIAGSIALWSALTMLCGVAQGAWQFIFCRFGVGAAESGATAAAYSVISDSFPPERRPLAFSIMISGTMIGLTVGVSLGGWIGAEYGWRTAFMVMGAPGLLLALAVYLFVKPPPRGASDATPPVVIGGQGFGALLRNRPFVWLAMSNAVGTFNIYVVSLWLPSFFVRTHHLPLGLVSLVFGLAFGLGMLAGTLLGGAAGAVTAKRDPLDLRLPTASYLALPVLYWLLLWLPNAWIAIGLVIVAAVVFGLGNPIFSAASQGVVAPEDRAKAMAAVVLGNSIIGYGLGSYVIGLLSDLLAPVFGAQSLRLALSLGQVFPIFGGLCLIMATLAIRAERAAGIRAPAPARS